MSNANEDLRVVAEKSQDELCQLLDKSEVCEDNRIKVDQVVSDEFTSVKVKENLEESQNKVKLVEIIFKKCYVDFMDHPMFLNRIHSLIEFIESGFL